ncbi:MAG: hypothetical protein QOK14_693, partial [Frankiaceae bacterium]|nr:hypothetical protein [Frankiaceae bacterium]
MSRPAAIDPRGPRFAAVITTVVLAVAILTRSAWVLGAQATVFALGSAGLSPYQWLFKVL